MAAGPRVGHARLAFGGYDVLGAICGDVTGSTYEVFPVKTKRFTLLNDGSCVTDDSVCTAAVASAILRDRSFERELRAWAGASSSDNFGPDFLRWAALAEGVGNSAGNGAVMRVSAIPWLADGLSEALDLGARSAIPSHDHPDAVRAALAAVAAGRLALEGWEPDRVATVVGAAFGHDLTTPLGDYRASYRFDVLAEGTVGPSLRAAIEATSFEDALRNAISMGGDADTMAAIAGGVAEAWHPVPPEIRAFVEARLPRPIREVLAAFETRVRGRRVAKAPVAAVPAVLAAARERWVEGRSREGAGGRRVTAWGRIGALARRAAGR